VAPLGDGHPEIKVPGPSDWGFYDGLVTMCLTKHHTMKTYWRSGGISPCILDLGTRLRCVISFMPWPFYPQGRRPWYPSV
jgi:hypothetical protein